jgi:hypothetical protein
MKIAIGILFGLGLAVAVMLVWPHFSKAEAGPNGGDVVPLSSGQAKAEVLANADTGEVMVHTWDKDLKTSQPVEAKPLMIGSGDQTIELQPHPTASDPSGFCSRFYGQAEWMRGGRMQHGWMSDGAGQSHHEFAMRHGWMGGQAHGSMWSDMGNHRRGMGNGMGAGMMGNGPGSGMRRE